MPIAKIWVVAEAADGKVTTSTLELLTWARATGATVEAVIADDGAKVAAELGAFGATTVHATGDLGGSLPGAPTAGAIAAAVAGGAPDLILLSQSYDGRDIAGRLSVKLDRTVLTNAVGLEVGRQRRRRTCRLRWRQDRQGHIHRPRSTHRRRSTQVVHR